METILAIQNFVEQFFLLRAIFFVGTAIIISFGTVHIFSYLMKVSADVDKKHIWIHFMLMLAGVVAGLSSLFCLFAWINFWK